jgi:glycosyltransferase involved in cell wall biosynthesis
MPAEAPELSGAEVLYVLLRWKGRPVGRLLLDASTRLDAAGFRHEALSAASAGLFCAELEIGAPVREANVSVIVATRNRPERLEVCLEALRKLRRQPGEIVVGDSGSSCPDDVRKVAERHGARVVRLERPGLSVARNAAARVASGSVLAFLDDDCRADPGWLEALCHGFSDDTVDAVAGQLLPAELRTEAQRLFLRYSHMDRRGFVPHRFRGDVAESPHWPLDVWRIGSGGNLALRSTAFDRVSGFNCSLGLGTPARGGEDLFALWSILESGGTVVYRPDAMAWHTHHRQLDSLRSVMFGYGVGHTAYLRAVRAAGASFRAVSIYRSSFYADRLVRLARSLVGRAGFPPGLVVREVSGSFVGGFLGRRAERQAAP